MSPFQNLAQLTSSQIVNCFVLGTAIAALAASGIALARRKSSALRFAIWLAALVAMASSFFLWRPAAHALAATRVSAPELSLRPEWALYIFGLWAFFAAIGIARVVQGLWRVRCLKKSCTSLDPSLADCIAESVAAVRESRATFSFASRNFALCTSHRLRVPAALGFFRPVIALPAWAVRELSLGELKTVVLHEAAHLQRWDDWTNLLQKLIRALLFFHPAVWWIDSRLSIEREICCDDVVLARSRSARLYAACLVSLAEKTHAHQSLALVQAAVGHFTQTARRISKILDGNEREIKPVLKPVLASVVVFGALSFVAVQHTPQLVAFRNDALTSTRSTKNFDYVATGDRPRASAVPASLTLSSSRPATQAAHQTNEFPSVKRGVNRTHVASPLTEEARGRFQPRTPTVINAAANNDDAAPRFIYLVSQTEQYDSFGNVTITTAVWRMKVAKPAQVQAPALPHQI